MFEINTVNTKAQQLTNGYFKIGSGSEVILIIGSCRTVPYLNYLNIWNEQNGNRFTITFADPYNWCYDINDNRINLEEKINSLETDERLLDLFKSVKYFIHEYYVNFGLFNCDKNADKNIYQFGIKPEVDICIPNWNDCFVLVADIISFDSEVRKKVLADYNVLDKLSDQTIKELYIRSQNNIEKFYEVCMKSDVPEMKRHFQLNHIFNRFFWNSNHVSKDFTLAVFKFINEDYLHLELSESFWEEISEHDMYANNYTFLTDIDIQIYGYKWNEEVKSLREYL